MKKSSAYPVVKALLPKKINAQPLKIFSSKPSKTVNKRTSTLSELAQVLQDDSTLNFLNALEEEQEQDGILLKTILDEVRSARKAGLCIQQTDQHLLNIVNQQQH
jgi:ferritin-like protein 2